MSAVMNANLKKPFAIGCLLCGLMLLSGWAAKLAEPTVRIADSHAQIMLDSAVPKQFGDWREDVSQASAVINPTTEQALQRIYAQTLSRTYVNQQGARIMLSIAYGADQRDNLSVHFPEGCYGGQGFAVTAVEADVLKTGQGTLPVSRMVATLNNRIEPISYWVMVGEKAVRDSWEMKKVKLAYALKREIPDATLVRVSNIDPDAAEAYQLQQQFVSQMFDAMTPQARRHFSGFAL